MTRVPLEDMMASERRELMEKLCEQEPITQFFAFDHLPEHLQKISAPFCNMMADIVQDVPRNPERTVALRKLLEAKDAAVRAVLYK